LAFIVDRPGVAAQVSSSRLLERTINGLLETAVADPQQNTPRRRARARSAQT
jgi:hypothetical protein